MINRFTGQGLKPPIGVQQFMAARPRSRNRPGEIRGLPFGGLTYAGQCCRRGNRHSRFD
jgi:hypothetical protein